MAERIVIDVDRDGWTKGLQLNIAQLDENDCGSGYRLHGPKYNGSSANLLRHELDQRDAAEIRQALDAGFPPPPADEAALWQRLADTVNAIAETGVTITARHDSYIGYSSGPWVFDAPGRCVVFDEDTGRWVVEDRTRRCPECRVSLRYASATYCSTACRNRADRHDQPGVSDA